MDEAQILAELRAQVAAIRGGAARQQGLKRNPQGNSSNQQSASVASTVDRGAIQDSLAEVRISQSAFGEINPRNAGFLNALAQTIKKSIRRLLSWYTRSLQIFHASVARALEVQGRAIIFTADQLSSSHAQLLQLTDQQLSIQSKVSSIEPNLVSLQNEFGQFKASLRSTIDERFRTLTQQLQQARDVADLARRDQQSPYVAYFKNLSPVVDLGCGRGEFLELLKEAGIAAHGVDSDPVACAEARAKALKVIEADVFSYLRQLPERCLGGVFSARVAEYLPTTSLAELISLCSRKMKPGGIIVMEATTPASDSPFGRNYHVDASHYHPIYPEVLKAMIDGNEFIDSTISVLAPQPVSLDVARSAGTSPDNCPPADTEQLASARAYAVIARRG